jgi:hypothetical protein
MNSILVRWLFAAVHLLGLGVGLGAVWGIAAVLWIGTGLVRAFGGLEKGSAYYLHNHLFWTKMGLLGLILVLRAEPNDLPHFAGGSPWRAARRPIPGQPPGSPRSAFSRRSS